MPGAVGRTSTYALCNVTFPYIQRIVNEGLEAFATADCGLAEAINVHRGKLTNRAVAKSLGMTCEAFAQTA